MPIVVYTQEAAKFIDCPRQTKFLYIDWIGKHDIEITLASKSDREKENV